MISMTDYVDLTRFIASAIVTDTNALDVEVEEDDHQTMVFIRVAEEDMPRMIGKGGHVISAVRNVLRAAGLRNHQRVLVELTAQDS